MNLSLRLVVLCVAAVLPAASIQVASELGLRRQRTAEVNAEATRAAMHAASEIDRIIAGTRQLLGAVAFAPSVVAREDERCAVYIADLERQFTEYARLVVADRQGRLFCVSAEVPPGFGLADLPYFQEAVRSGRFAVGDYAVGRLTGRPVLPLAVPIHGADGEVDRVAIAALDLRWLSAHLEERGLPPGGSVTVADRSGTIVARAPLPDRFVGTRIPDEFLPLVHASQPGSLPLVSQDGTRRVLGFVPVGPSLGLYVSAGLSFEENFAIVDRATWSGFLLIGIGLLSAMLAALLVGRLYIAPPIRRLLAAMDQWRQGKTEARVGSIAASSELTRLSEGFDAMADALEARTRALQASEERLRLAQEAGGIGTFEVDIGKGQSFVNEGLLALHGLPPDAAADFSYERWLSLVHPDDQDRVDKETRAELWIADGYRNEYRIIRANNAAVRWIQVRSRRQPAAGGQGARVLGVNIDVTERREAEEALRASEERLRLATEAAGLGVWEIDIGNGHVRWSPELFVLFGLDAHADGPMTPELTLEVVHPDDRELLSKAWAAALESGNFAAEFRGMRRRADGSTEERWLLSRGRVLDGQAGKVMIGVSLDITERRRAEERLVLLAREVDHRAKNALAVVQSALRLTPRQDVEAYAGAVEGRVSALARAQTLLAADRWTGAELRSLLEGELAPFLGGSQRVDLAGPSVVLPPGATQAIAMTVHELATNAVKHGALSVPDGRVSVSWSVAGEVLRLHWAEAGGPRLDGPPMRQGFGSRVLDSTVRGQLGGAVSRSWSDTGLVCDLEIPLRRLLTLAVSE
ncbi:HWE histidine kinase domain-containing protein [Falsiroseomonas sp. HW251]|uniref:HWE histidine kinase domain-containing protein n=1 Tax=Falsiroseomonas sp. HW251 TaxID=3390998 RepID=UPI003D314366